MIAQTLRPVYRSDFSSLIKIAHNYKKAFNIPNHNFQYTGTMNPDSGKRIADIYHDLNHNPKNELVVAAYAQLAKEVFMQFKYIMTYAQIEFEPYLGAGEPYKNSAEMFDDLLKGHMYFFKTESGFGAGSFATDNIMLNKSGLNIGKYELVVNDLFRIVHDVFGHAITGVGFGPIGEDLAWFSHLNLFSPLAAAALSNETRGQNCWVNFGSHLRNAKNELYQEGESGYTPPPSRPFAEQKMSLLPSNASGIHVYKSNNKIAASYLKHWHPLESIIKEAA